MNFEETSKWLKEYLASDKIKIVNPTRAFDLIQAYQRIKVLLKDNDENTNIEIKHGALELGNAYIRIVTPQLTVYNTATFAFAILKADNVDIYPTADERLKIDIMFNEVYYVETI